MARTAGITQEQVNLAAAELVAAGKTPGVRNVREALGTGSNQTIQAMLQHWQKAQPLPAAADAEPVELPPELLQAMQAALGSAKAATAAEYQEAIASAQAQRDRATQDALTQYSEYEQQLENAALLSREAMELRGKNGELQKQVDALRETDQQRQAAEKRAAAAEATVSALQAKLQEQEALAKAATEAHGKAIAELKAAHAEALAKLQADAQRAAEKAAEELAQSAQALTKAQGQGVELGKELEAAKGRISALQAELAKAQGAQKAAEEKAGTTALELSKAEGRISVLQERAALVETLQQRVFKLEAQLPPAEPKKMAQEAAKR